MKDEIPYSAGFAEIYDDAYRDKPYGEEVAFLDAVANPSGKRGLRVVDLSCGTGRHLEAFRRIGWECCGSDLSAAMVEVARSRVPGADLRIADMREISAQADWEGAFDLCVSLFDSIGYALTNEAVVAAMASARQVLKPGGWFAFEVWSAAKFLRSAAASRRIDFEDARGRRVVRLGETEADPARMSARVHYTFFVEEEGRWRRFEETHENRYFGVPELQLLLAAAGWTSPPRHFGGYAGQEVDGESWHILTLLQNT